MRIYRWSFVLVLVGLVTVSCSRTKDTFLSRTFHKMTAKFNPLFNGEQAFLQGYNSLVSGHRDDYDDILELYPFGDEEQAQAIVPQMDRAIEKSIKVIREHSMTFNGKQKNPYVIDAYMLMSKASFFKREYFKALEGFNYVLQRFPESEQAVEARLWIGRSNTRIESEFAARQQFEELYADDDVTSRMKPHIFASTAEMEIAFGHYDEAIEMLNKALEADPSRDDRIRWQYVLGQLYERKHLRQEASDAFGKVVKDHPSNYEFYLNAQLMRALNYDVSQGNILRIYRDLENLAKDDKNTEFRDRIFYIMALLALEDEDYMKAEESLKRSIRASLGNDDQKGLSYLTLAEINFEFRAYVVAQAYYDSAFTTLPRDHSKFHRVERFRTSLSSLVEQIRTIETNDSLIRLAGMSTTQQRAIFEEYIANLKDAEERAAEAEANRALNRQLAEESAARGGGPTAGVSAGGWYFYNESTRGAGMSEFSRLWGNRPLTDNWRQSAKAAGAVATTTSQTSETEGGGDSDGGPSNSSPSGEQRYNIDAYLAQVPKSQETIDEMHLQNQDAYIRMANIYKEEIEDEQEALNAYRKLLERYPETKHAPMALYALYLIHKDRGETAKAEEYATRLRNQFPDSEFTAQLDGKLQERNEELAQASEAYRAAYDKYVSKSYRDAKRMTEAGLTTYGNTAIGPKFNLLLALIVAKTDGPEAYANELRKVVASYQGTIEAERANELLQHVDNSSGPVGEVGNSPYIVDPKTPHRVLIIFPNNAGNANELRTKVSDYNSEYDRLQNLQVQSIFLDRQRQVLVVSGFTQFSEALQYSERVVENPQVKTVYSSEIMRIFAISDANYQTFYRLKDVDEYMTFYDQITSR